MTERMRSITRLRRTLVAAILAVLPSGAGAQEGRVAPSQDDEDTRRHGIFIDSLDVSLINVEVHVTRDGVPVEGLTAEDFEVFDDGQAVTITNFYRVEAGERIEVSEPAASTDEEQSPAALAPRLSEPSSVVVLVDNPFISPMSRKLVFDRLAGELDRLMSDGTQVMVVNAGHYRDRWVRTPEGWRIAERVCEQTLMLGELPDQYSIPD